MKESRDGFKLLVLASLVTLGLSFVPYAEVITYPFRIFVTFVHETGHALATWLTFGSVSGMNVNPDGSGVTYSQGGSTILLASAGYLGSTLFGALLLLLCKRGSAAAKRILAAIAASLLGVTVLLIGFGFVPFLLTTVLAAIGLFWFAKPKLAGNLKVGLGIAAGICLFTLISFQSLTGSLFAWIAGLTIGVGLFFCAKYLQPPAAHFLLSFLAVQCCLNALVDIKTLFLLSAFTNGHNDARIMESVTAIPAVFWSVVWAAVSLAILAAALWSYRKALGSGKIAYTR